MKTKKLLLILFFILFSFGCAKAQKIASITPTGDLTGKVSPVMQASISVYKNTIKLPGINSNPASGEFSITNLDSGSYVIVASAAGFEPLTKNVLIQEGQTTKIMFNLTKSSPALENLSKLTTNLIIEKSTFKQGETINLTVTLTNPTDQPILIPFPAGGRWIPYFILTDNNNIEVWNSLHGLAFILVYMEAFINPGETWTHTEIWNGQDNKGNILTPGEYKLTAIGCKHDPKSSDSLTIQIKS